jgi:hypothetical protein
VVAVADDITTVITTLARPRVEAAAAGLNGLEIAVGFTNEIALRKVPIGSSSRGGTAKSSAKRKGMRARSSASPRGRMPGGRGGASMGNSGAGFRIEPSTITLATLAAIHEFGAPRANVPERRPMRRAFEEGRSSMRRYAIKVLQAVGSGKQGRKEIDRMADFIKRAVQRAIRSTTTPPMSERHRARRIAMGDANPQLLYDLHQLHDGVTVVVRKGART